ncbi:hypothetical protein DFJ74DRAFT_694293 [Hyaloraphidium curvatum]|nr:hypothetical protein DFJ74DRAFT_694293 [Hyaloraphidium curvatum]
MRPGAKRLLQVLADNYRNAFDETRSRRAKKKLKGGCSHPREARALQFSSIVEGPRTRPTKMAGGAVRHPKDGRVGKAASEILPRTATPPQLPAPAAVYPITPLRAPSTPLATPRPLSLAPSPISILLSPNPSFPIIQSEPSPFFYSSISIPPHPTFEARSRLAGEAFDASSDHASTAARHPSPLSPLGSPTLFEGSPVDPMLGCFPADPIFPGYAGTIAREPAAWADASAMVRSDSGCDLGYDEGGPMLYGGAEAPLMDLDRILAQFTGGYAN